MALNLFPIPFPIFAPSLNPIPGPNLISQPHHRPPTEIHFSRWNNANAREFNNRRRAQKEIEDDIRRHRRFNAATNIIDDYDSAAANLTSETFDFKSRGTPSSPSAPSIPGRKSKYSKPEAPKFNHPAFRPLSKVTKIRLPNNHDQKPIHRNAEVKLTDDGLSFIVDGAPFEFKYSYTETPKVKPVKLREPPFSPFGPTTMGRPWTGRAPLPPSKKKLREFDSFMLPPPDKKGVKPVQKPGPFLPGSVPRYVYTREEILGEPLTKDEVKNLIEGCLKTRRQLNMGRDGLTHNMLDNIHAHWKRRRVCKIKCLGVCTVDMDNVCQQLEERTGGKVIFRKGGVVYLFRGRNYNYRTRPRFPIMLWRPVTPVYPRLIQRVPEGLTLDEATGMRRKGRTLIPICKLAKNGVYCNLVKDVREAFEECELVRIDCQGVKGSDYRKMGAKLKELVPCVLISFEHEHILMWRGKDWKSSLTEPVNGCEEAKGSDVNAANSVAALVEDQISETISQGDVVSEPNMNMTEQAEDPSVLQTDETSLNTNTNSSGMCGSNPLTNNDDISAVNDSEVISNTVGNEAFLTNLDYAEEMPVTVSESSNSMLENVGIKENLHDNLGSNDIGKPANMRTSYVDGVLQLRKQAVESGSAVVLDDEDLDADIVYQRAVAFAKSAPPGPVFSHGTRKPHFRKPNKQENKNLEDEEFIDFKDSEIPVSQTTGSETRNFKTQRNKKSMEQNLSSAPIGSLGVDDLAKLLAYH